MRTLCCVIVTLLCTVQSGWAWQLPGQQEPALTLRELVQILDRHTDVVRLGETQGPMLVVTPNVGAIVLGAAPGGMTDRNLLWVSPAIKKEEFWKRPSPLMGGIRSNLAPQWGGPRTRVGSSPGRGTISGGLYRLRELSGNMATFAIPFHLQNDKGKRYRGVVTRTIELLSAEQVPHIEDVQGMGFRITHGLTNTGNGTWGVDADPIGLWSIAMLPSGGTAISPILWGQKNAFRDYGSGGNTVQPQERVRQNAEVVAYKADGKEKGKIGTLAHRTRPYAAYLRHTGGNPGLLVVTKFLVDPRARYVDRPRDDQTGNGDVAQYYNSDGTIGHYLEVENHSPAMNLAPGESQEHATITWLYTGPMDKLKKLGGRIMQIDMNKIPYFH